MCVGAAGGIFETTFNNYLNETFSITADTRGYLEFPREFPGFLTALFAGALFFLPETAIGVVCALSIAAGMFGLAAWGQQWGSMLLFLLLWSTGVHLLMPIRASLGLALATKESQGRRLGEISAVGRASGFVGCGLVWLLLRALRLSYTATFVAGGIAALCGAVCLAGMRMPDAHLRRPRFIWRKAYWLFYTLEVLSGARKQVFMTFGPWVLVKLYDQPAYRFAQLWIVGGLLGVLVQPLAGRLIDRVGERKVLMVDAVLMMAVCGGYALGSHLPSRLAVLGLLFSCYVLDHLLFGLNMARATYLAKTAVRPEDVAPTLSLGVTVNHAVSMVVPALGGLLWVRCGFQSVFYAAAGVALLTLFFASQMRVPTR
jgi:hypothetical protein